MSIHFIRSNLLFFDQALDEGMVSGEDGEFSIAQEVGAAISDVDDEGLVVLDEGGGDGTAEAARA